MKAGPKTTKRSWEKAKLGRNCSKYLELRDINIYTGNYNELYKYLAFFFLSAVQISWIATNKVEATESWPGPSPKRDYWIKRRKVKLGQKWSTQLSKRQAWAEKNPPCFQFVADLEKKFGRHQLSWHSRQLRFLSRNLLFLSKKKKKKSQGCESWGYKRNKIGGYKRKGSSEKQVDWKRWYSSRIRTSKCHFYPILLLILPWTSRWLSFESWEEPMILEGLLARSSVVT